MPADDAAVPAPTPPGPDSPAHHRPAPVRVVLVRVAVATGLTAADRSTVDAVRAAVQPLVDDLEVGAPEQRDELTSIVMTGSLQGSLSALRQASTVAAADTGWEVAALSGPLLERAGLLVLDVDSTLITAEVIELLAEHAGTREQVAAVTERAMRGELDFAESLRARVSTLAGLGTQVLEQVLHQVHLNPGATALIGRAREHGATVGLVSGGFTEVVTPVAHLLGINHVRANSLEVAEGRLTGRVSGEVVDRAGKAATLLEWAEQLGVPAAETVAIGDGANDLDMLAAAGLGIAYRAKPVVEEAADARIRTVRLDVAAEYLRW